MRAIALIAALTAIAPIAAAQPIQEQAQRPPPLVPQPGCEVWHGRNLAGNDPSILWEMRLCPAGHALPTLFQTSSLVSGWSAREGRGSWDPASTLWRGSETRFAENRPQPGWQFCLIERWELRRVSEARLAAEYDSAACRDHSRVDFQLVGTTSSTTPLPPNPNRPLPPPPPPPPSTRGTCGIGACAAAPSRGVPPAWGLFALALILLRKKERPA